MELVKSNGIKLESTKSKELREKAEKFILLTTPVLNEITKLRATIMPKIIFYKSTGKLEMKYPAEFLEIQSRYEEIIKMIHGVIYGTSQE